MEQRNFTNKSDIKPIEDLISGKQTPPEVYPSPYAQTRNAAGNKAQRAREPQRSPDQAPIAPTATRTNPVRIKTHPDTVSREARPGLFADNHVRAERIKDRITPDKVTKKKLNLKNKAPFLWASLGFIFGVAFWHTVGFWNFIEDAVMQEPVKTKLSVSVLRKQQTALKNKTLAQTVTPQNVGSCINLIIHRKTGKTSSSPCQPGITFYKGGSSIRTTAYRDH